jgi:glycosyltransferase involved in cell wall biosynthesis
MTSADVIAFATRYDSRDVAQWSGTPFHMAHALERVAPGRLVRIGPLHDSGRSLHRARALVHRLGPWGYLRDREPALLRGWGEQVGRAVSRVGADVVVSPSSLPVAWLPPRSELAVWTDATFAGMVATNPAFASLTRRQLRAGHDVERRMLDRARLVAYSSEWARRSAIDDYGADPARVHVLGFGPNLASLPGLAAVERAIRARTPSPLRLLLLGVDWRGKGADIAVEVARRLVERGVPTVLDVVGMVPPRGTRLPSCVRIHGFLRKSDPHEAAQLADLVRAAHLSVLPTRFDCTPVAVAEAAAHGVPCIAPAVGGLRSVVVDGESGLLVPPGAGADAYVDRIVAVISTPGGLPSLARGARHHQQLRLDWRRSATHLLDLLRAAPGTHRTQVLS